MSERNASRTPQPGVTFAPHPSAGKCNLKRAFYQGKLVDPTGPQSSFSVDPSGPEEEARSSGGSTGLLFCGPAWTRRWPLGGDDSRGSFSHPVVSGGTITDPLVYFRLFSPLCPPSLLRKGLNTDSRVYFASKRPSHFSRLRRRGFLVWVWFGEYK